MLIQDIMFRLLAILLVLVSCTTGEKFPFKCPSDGICTDPERPFCDVNGVYPESQNIPNTCIPEQDEFYCETHGTFCDGNDFYVCAAGKFTTPTNCNLGCSEEGTPHCKRIVPSNNLLQFMDMTHQSQHFKFGNEVVIDTDAELVTEGGVPVPVPMLFIPSNENDGVELAVLFAKSFSAEEVMVVGRSAFAIVATGPIELRNTFKIGNAGYYHKGCADQCPAGGVGGGGQGNDGMGGDGAVGFDGGGAHATRTIEPLVGGCSELSGGALQLASSTSVTITGEIHAMGKGGTQSAACVAGGGAGGSVLIEAPVVEISDGGGISANGGSGACESKSGNDGEFSDQPKVGASCGANGVGGDGAAGLVGAGDGRQGAAGGGGAGIIVINSSAGIFEPGEGTVISPVHKEGTVTIE